jgi:hypothetical protein
MLFRSAFNHCSIKISFTTSRIHSIRLSTVLQISSPGEKFDTEYLFYIEPEPRSTDRSAVKNMKAGGACRVAVEEAKYRWVCADEREYYLDDSKTPATLPSEALAITFSLGARLWVSRESTALALTSVGAIRGAGETCYLQDLENSSLLTRSQHLRVRCLNQAARNLVSVTGAIESANKTWTEDAVWMK